MQCLGNCDSHLLTGGPVNEDLPSSPVDPWGGRDWSHRTYFQLILSEMSLVTFGTPGYHTVFYKCVCLHVKAIVLKYHLKPQK